MANRRDTQFFYTPHNKPTLLDCSFVVDSTNGNGLGIRSLKASGRIASVFMKTSATPGKAANGQLNPNPATGIIVVTLQDNYNTYLNGFSGAASALSGSSISISTGSSLTVGAPYIITSLGTSTTAQWQAVGLSAAIKPAVGASFIASATSGAGTGTVQAPASAGIDHFEVIGDANQMNNTLGATIVGSGVGMQIIVGCYLNTTLTAPANGSVIGMSFYLNNSAQGV